MFNSIMNDNQGTVDNWIAVIEVVKAVKSKITIDTDLLWTNYNSVEELISEINLIENLLTDHNKQGLQFLGFLFAPTGTLQEISMQNDWIQEYLNWSLKFDELYEKLK
jgi:hypothetical protein